MSSETNTLQSQVLKALRFPIEAAKLVRQRLSIKKELLKQANLTPARVLFSEVPRPQK